MEGKSEDLSREGEVPQPGTKEPDNGGDGDSTEGPGNVSVDEPTEPALEAESLGDLPDPPGGEPKSDGDDDDGDGDEEGNEDSG